MKNKTPLVLALPAALALGACVHAFRQRFTEPHVPDFPSIQAFAELAAAAYADAPAVEAACHRRGYARVVVRSLPATDNRYFLATDTATHRHLISIQGTSNLRNVLLDASYDKARDALAGVLLHRGFQAAALHVLADATPLMDKGNDVFLTGHSLGGAEAVVLAMYLKAAGWKVAQVVTFGQPRVTDQDGAEASRGLPLLRIVNVKDPVPLTPPLEVKYLLKPYAHLGREITLLDGPYFSYLEEGNEGDASGLAFWEGLKSADQFKKDLPSHSMATYLSRLEAKQGAIEEVPYADRLAHFTPDAPPAP